MSRGRIILLCLLLAGGGYLIDQCSGGGPSLTGVAAIAESAQRERAGAQAKVYELLAARIRAGEFADGSAIGTETERMLNLSPLTEPTELQKSAKASLPEGPIEDAEAVAAWYEAVAKGFRRVAE